MTREKKIQPLMPDSVYRINLWFYKLFDLFWNPGRHLKRIPLKDGMTVVDYGSGPGRYTLPLARLVGPRGKVLAVDIQPLAIKTTEEKAARQGLTNVEPILVDSYSTGIQGSSVDLVLLIDTLHMIDDCGALFREIHRLLNPDGILFMDPGHTGIPKAKELIEGTGLFTVVECRGREMLVSPRNKI